MVFRRSTICLLFFGLLGCALSSPLILDPRELNCRCCGALRQFGASHLFGVHAGHAIHSISVQDLQKFEPNATETNGIPTVNLDLTSTRAILPNAPLADSNPQFVDEGMQTINRVLMHMDDKNYEVLNYSPLERVAHAFHMRDMWAHTLREYQTVKRLGLTKDACKCARDIRDNGIFKTLQFAGIAIREPSLAYGGFNFDNNFDASEKRSGQRNKEAGQSNLRGSDPGNYGFGFNYVPKEWEKQGLGSEQKQAAQIPNQATTVGGSGPGSYGFGFDYVPDQWQKQGHEIAQDQITQVPTQATTTGGSGPGSYGFGFDYVPDQWQKQGHEIAQDQITQVPTQATTTGGSGPGSYGFGFDYVPDQWQKQGHEIAQDQITQVPTQATTTGGSGPGSYGFGFDYVPEEWQKQGHEIAQDQITQVPTQATATGGSGPGSYGFGFNYVPEEWQKQGHEIARDQITQVPTQATATGGSGPGSYGFGFNYVPEEWQKQGHEIARDQITQVPKQATATGGSGPESYGFGFKYVPKQWSKQKSVIASNGRRKVPEKVAQKPMPKLTSAAAWKEWVKIADMDTVMYRDAAIYLYCALNPSV